MTPRTRTSNKDANYEVYYSKKIPQQVHFPHKTKTVRRPDPVEQDGVAKRQMRFLPEKMRQQQIQDHKDSDEETEEESEVQKVAVEKNEKKLSANSRTGNKRKSSDVKEEPASGEEQPVNSSKRRKRTAAPKDELSRTLRRQSTMTQLADGRRPSFDDDEPDFSPVKWRNRASWGSASTERKRDRKQRTLTQMIPGMGRLSKEELEELSDLDADLDQTSKDAVIGHLVEQGVVEIDEPAAMTVSVQHYGDIEEGSHCDQAQDQCGSSITAFNPSLVSQSVGTAAADDDDEDDYQPTQFIEAPTLRYRQTPRKTATRDPPSNAPGLYKSTKSRFSLLSTPEKRRVFEIPSSQSPAESIGSTEISPQKSNRSAFRARSSNLIAVAETPSKHRQVTFREPTIQCASRVHLRRFKSTIQDSEDEGSELEDDLATQNQPNDSQWTYPGQALDADKQAVLQQIDQACGNYEDDLLKENRNTSDEPEEQLIRSVPYRSSPELGESWAPVMFDDYGPQYDSYRSPRTSAKSQSLQAANSFKESLPVLRQSNHVSQMDLTTQAPMLVDDVSSTPLMIPSSPRAELLSTPMVIGDVSSDEEQANPEPTPPRIVQRRFPEPPSTLIHQSTDLDGEPVQVPRSPSAECETQQSHSSKAEQQLQNEWLSYSQYVHARAPKSSSKVTAGVSRYNAIPHHPNGDSSTASSSRVQHSQATTVDELTPRKNKTQPLITANTTPNRATKSQPFVSPEKPPSLFIPSSFPSPSRTVMEGWSSPVLSVTQNMYGSSQVLGTLEDFSIPLPPPVEDE